MIKKIFFIIALTLCSSFTSTNWSEILKQKVDKAIKLTFELDNYSMEEIIISDELSSKVPSEMNKSNFYKLKSNDDYFGYAYIGKAPSMKKEFDFIIMFDKDLIIKKSKILIYREDHGKQIGSQRWLKQFIGKEKKEKLEYGENIAAISGATISASSMTKATNNVLKSVNILYDNDIIELKH